MMMLEVLGHEARVAYSGPQALDLLDQFEADVIFLDIGMPGMDGYEVARRLRQHPRTRHVLLAAITGWGKEEDRLRCFDAGFDHHRVKPVEPTSLQTLLETPDSCESAVS